MVGAVAALSPPVVGRRHAGAGSGSSMSSDQLRGGCPTVPAGFPHVVVRGEGAGVLTATGAGRAAGGGAAGATAFLLRRCGGR